MITECGPHYQRNGFQERPELQLHTEGFHDGLRTDTSTKPQVFSLAAILAWKFVSNNTMSTVKHTVKILVNVQTIKTSREFLALK